jgi:hypothetical protein
MTGASMRRMGFTYGDQGLFTAARTFNAIGGYRNIPIMEDVEIQRRLRPRGRFVKLDIPAVTSARRFLRRGIIRLKACFAITEEKRFSISILTESWAYPPSSSSKGTL